MTTQVDSSVADEREFPTLAVVSAVTGTLVSDIIGVYDVLNHITGHRLYTHELPAASYEAQPTMEARWPWMASIPHGADPELREWCAAVVAEHGDTLLVPTIR